ncbi:Universal stress protein UspA [Serinicoccus hydrothermalis]|uniref:Universal stress protein UspA n=1 Tax=Serinicoccus hydrothermalis TaxID=1758689 RepID=A0A1B1NFC1_9MICO|nr:universal stress protein [Serinicoccus hydrothermalis]ANS80132.1 Universal stress protein UspA [Serinicoccus hydrothermalis]
MTFPTRILLATDGSPSAALARDRVIDLVRHTEAEVHVVHVALVSPWTNPSPLSPSLRERIEAEARPVLADTVSQLEGAHVGVGGSHLRTGRATDEILRLRDEIDADLIVIGSRGQNAFVRVLLGNDAEGIVRHAPCAVLVVRTEEGAR